jgi:hypothetical protein
MLAKRTPKGRRSSQQVAGFLLPLRALEELALVMHAREHGLEAAKKLAKHSRAQRTRASYSLLGDPAPARAVAAEVLDTDLARMAMRLIDGDYDDELLRKFEALRDLSRALEELDRGIASPMFQPRRSRNRPTLNHAQTTVRRIVAAAYAMLRELGTDHTAAAESIATLLRRPNVAPMLQKERALGSAQTTPAAIYKIWKAYRPPHNLIGDELSWTGATRSTDAVLDAAENRLRRFFRQG